MYIQHSLSYIVRNFHLYWLTFLEVMTDVLRVHFLSGHIIQHHESRRHRGARKTRELNQARSKPDAVDRPVRTARTFVHHYNRTQQYCSTETVLLTLSFLQTYAARGQSAKTVERKKIRMQPKHKIHAQSARTVTRRPRLLATDLSSNTTGRAATGTAPGHCSVDCRLPIRGRRRPTRRLTALQQFSSPAGLGGW